jgi:hypothetical protein
VVTLLIAFGATIAHLGVALLVARKIYARWRRMSIEKRFREDVERSEEFRFLPMPTDAERLKKAVDDFNEYDRGFDIPGAFCIAIFWEATVPFWLLGMALRNAIIANPAPSDTELKVQVTAMRKRIRELEEADRAYRREHDGV